MEKKEPETGKLGTAAEPPESASPEKSGWGSFLATVFIVVLISSIVSASAVAYYHENVAQKIVVVDMRAFIKAQGEKIRSTGNVKEADKDFERLEKLLDSVPPNQVVLLNDVVVRNAEKIFP